MPFDFSPYCRVEVRTPTTCSVFGREAYCEIGSYYYDSTRDVQYRFDYSILKPGHHIFVSERYPQTNHHVGLFVTVLRLRDYACIAYTKPTSWSIDDSVHLYCKSWKATNSMEPVLYMVPLDWFISRLFVYPLDGQLNALIRV